MPLEIEGGFVIKLDKHDDEFKGARIPRIIRFTDSIFNKLNKVAIEDNISFDLLVLQCCKYALDERENEIK